MRPRSLLTAATALTAIASLAAAPAVTGTTETAPTSLGAPLAATDACATGSATAATAALVAPLAEATGTAQVAGLDVVRTLDPLIAPGIAGALLDVDGVLCTPEAFNLAAPTLLPGATAAELATAFASVAGMNYLGDVVARDLHVDGRTVRLTTVGGRHGAVSDWTVTVDDAGIVSARFETTGWEGALADTSIGGLEGVTSLPGHSRTWTRGVDGLLAVDATVRSDLADSYDSREEDIARAAAVVGNEPGDPLDHTGADGQQVIVSLGLSPYTPDAGVDTHVEQADRLRSLHAGLVRNYTQMESFGLVDPWDNTTRTYLGRGTVVPDEAGYVNIESGLSAYCLACAVVADTFEIHIAYVFPDVAPEVVGASYDDRAAFLNDVLYHEMVHSVQGGYSSGRASRYTNSFLEGIARASESLTDTAAGTFQPGSIAYLDNGNGCEGFENGRGSWITAQSRGAFDQGHTYDSCYLFWTYFAEHGGVGMMDLIKTMDATLDANAQGNSVTLSLASLRAASPSGDGLADLARWGGAFATGAGYGIEDGTGTRNDWFSLLRPANRASTTASAGNVDVRNGGVMAFTVTKDGAITGLPNGAAAYVATVADDRSVDVRPVTIGDAVVAGDVISIVAPDTGTYTGQLIVS